MKLTCQTKHFRWIRSSVLRRVAAIESAHVSAAPPTTRHRVHSSREGGIASGAERATSHSKERKTQHLACFYTTNANHYGRVLILLLHILFL